MSKDFVWRHEPLTTRRQPQDRSDSDRHSALGCSRLGLAGDTAIRMKRSRSITVRLSLVFLLLFFVALLLGAFGIGSLSYFNGVFAPIRDRWVPSTGALRD